MYNNKALYLEPIRSREHLLYVLKKHPNLEALRIDYSNTEVTAADILQLPDKIRWLEIKRKKDDDFFRHPRFLVFAHIYQYNDRYRDYRRCISILEANPLEENDPDYTNSCFLKAEALRLLGRLDDAMGELQKILRREPHYRAAIASCFAIYRAKEDWSSAMRTLILLSRFSTPKNLPNGLELSPIELKLMFLDRLPLRVRVKLLENCCAICLGGASRDDAPIDAWVELDTELECGLGLLKRFFNLYTLPLRPYHRECLLASAQTSSLDPVTRLPIAHYYEPRV
jgi:tetratricopeptide (TPR) repeat protein